jgi:hypothetical protein
VGSGPTGKLSGTAVRGTHHRKEVRNMVEGFEMLGELHQEISTLRVVAKREGKDPYTVSVPVKGNTFSLVLPNGYIDWPKGKPYPDSIRVSIDETRSLWVNFGVSKEYGFYASLRIGKPKE